MDERKLALADDIRGAILGAASYDEFMAEDVELAEAEKKFYTVTRKIMRLVPQGITDELLEAAAAICAAHSQAGVLYGIYAVSAIHEAVAHPAELSKYVVNRMAKERAVQ